MRLLCLMLFFVGLLSVPVLSQVEPQFKFYLAFEDAKEERDTVWFVMDTNCSSQDFTDSLYGEIKYPIDSIQFQTWLFHAGDGVYKTYATRPFGAAGSITYYIKAVNHTYPITVRWDTNLLKTHTLPFELKQATLYNQYTYGGCPTAVCCWHYKHLLDTSFYCPGMGRADSLILPAGIPSNHLFPIQVFFSKNPFTPPHGVEEPMGTKKFHIYPNPAIDIIKIQPTASLEFTELTVTIYDLSGRLIMEPTSKEVNVSQLPSGNYIVQITYLNHHYYENLVIMH